MNQGSPLISIEASTSAAAFNLSASNFNEVFIQVLGKSSFNLSASEIINGRSLSQRGVGIRMLESQGTIASTKFFDLAGVLGSAIYAADSANAVKIKTLLI